MKLPALKWAHPDRRGKAPTAFLSEAFQFIDPFSFGGRARRFIDGRRSIAELNWANIGTSERVDKLGAYGGCMCAVSLAIHVRGKFVA